MKRANFKSVGSSLSLGEGRCRSLPAGQAGQMGEVLLGDSKAFYTQKAQNETALPLGNLPAGRQGWEGKNGTLFFNRRA
jgi:hypothetical protein